MPTLRSLLSQGLNRLERRPHQALECFDRILAEIDHTPLFPDEDFDERTTEMQTLQLRQLRVVALKGCRRYQEAHQELASLIEYYRTFSYDPQTRGELQKTRALLYQEQGDREAMLGVLEEMLGEGSQARWAQSQKKKLLG